MITTFLTLLFFLTQVRLPWKQALYFNTDKTNTTFIGQNFESTLLINVTNVILIPINGGIRASFVLTFIEMYTVHDVLS